MATEALPEIDAQYRVLREGAGMLDRSARGKLAVRGAEAAEYLQGQLTNEIEALEPGQGCYAALLDRKGHIQADLRVLRMADDELWLDTEPAALEALRRHLETYKIGREVEIADMTAEQALLAVIGPAAADVTGVASGAEHTHSESSVGGISCRAVGTDLGIDLIAAAGDAAALRSALLEAGAVEVGDAAAEIVRVESGRPRFGNEMGPATMPAEAGIVERAVDFEKGCYIGQEPVARLYYRGKPNRHLRGLRLSAPAEPGATLRHGEREVGTLGSSVLSPALGPIALAVVRREAEPGATVQVGEGPVSAEVVELPFGAPA
ncbi:MAG: glycine cleavage T C-terminal barrel domain-containing protein [Actinomycetota bacterium]